MAGSTQGQVGHGDAELLGSLIEVGVNLSAIPSRHQMLDLILREARKLARAEAGTLYIRRHGRLRFAAAQNDRLDLANISEHLLGKEEGVSCDSLVGYVAMTGRTVNLPDTFSLPPGAPFSVNRQFDSATGYSTRSMLTVPLKHAEGECIGVLQLINRLNHAGGVMPFPPIEASGLLPLASMAAVTIHNAILQDDLREAHLETILRLSVAAEFRENTLGDHVRRISQCSALIARAMGLSPRQIELLEAASPMHDIGKIGVRDAVLLKPGPLSPEERRQVEQHTTIGAKILAEPQDELIATARDVALWHHERWDGTGYPDGLAGSRIPLSARIVGLADVFDALVSDRCYKRAYPLDDALKIIAEQSGKHFDPTVQEAFFRVVGDVLDRYAVDGEPLAALKAAR
jgi:HD-GYP domain-containing protein (c-di-GMP phosphodiesterase class II)